VNTIGTHNKCQESEACKGPGCRKHTGKTARKMNWKRPKPNQHEGSRGNTGSEKTGKKR
jgi:hypothetical protein